MQAVAPIQMPHIVLTTDVSGAWGCGMFCCETHRWIQCPWHRIRQDVPIHTKELLPILLAVATWGPYWRNSQILIRCDNMAVVNILSSSTSWDTLIMHLLRTLHFISAFNAINLIAQHIAGTENTVADAISCNLPQVLFSQFRKADPWPTPIPELLWDILVTHQPDWLSDTWRTLLMASNISNSLAPSSRKTYSSAQSRYLSFCSRMRINRIPATQQQLTLFAADLSQKIAHSSMLQMLYLYISLWHLNMALIYLNICLFIYIWTRYNTILSDSTLSICI